MIFSGFVLDIQSKGFPEEMDVECKDPEGYKTAWTDGIWRNGRWKNLELISTCIDPLRCYKTPPALPIDYTVEANLTKAKNMKVNTTIFYHCAKQCELNRNITHQINYNGFSCMIYSNNYI